MLASGHGIMRTDIDAEVVKKASNVASVALDAEFRSRGYRYGDFMGTLLENSIISLSSSVLARVGAFVVSRKDELQRLICDPRLAN